MLHLLGGVRLKQGKASLTLVRMMSKYGKLQKPELGDTNVAFPTS